MKLYVESELPVDPATAWEVFESAEYRERLSTRTGISQQVLSESEEGGVIRRTIRTEPDAELPAMVAKLLGATKLSYTQQSTFDPARSRLDWTVTLEVMADKVDVAGTTSIEPLSGGGSRRVVDGDIAVRVRFVGGQIEKAVVAQFEKSMIRAVDVALEIIRERNLA